MGVLLVVELIPNQPIYLLGNSVCNCPDADYTSPANRSDRVVLLVPNICTYDNGGITPDPILENDFGTPDQLPTWTQSEDNGFTGAWLDGGTYIKTLGDSKVLNKAAAIPAYHRYSLHLLLSLCPNVRLYIVGYTSATEYDILTYTDTDGDITLHFSTTKDYIKFGFYVDGICTGEGDYNTLAQLLLTQDFYSCSTSFCIKQNGVNTGVNLTPFTTSYEGFTMLDFYWSDLEISDGCYQVCICDGIFGENLFTDGDNGTMEAGITGLTGTDIAQASAIFYRGSYSASIVADSGFPDAVILDSTTTIVLKPNTEYKAAAKVYVDQVGDMPVGADIKLNFTATGITQTTVNLSASQVKRWITITDTFTTGNDYAEYTGKLQILSEGGTPTLSGVQVFFDEIILVEYQDLCSQPFDLRDDHDCTLLLTWNNDDEAFGFFPLANFNIRIKGYLTQPKYPEEQSQFEYSDGGRQLQYASTRKVVTLATEKLPEQLHDAIRVGVLHDHFYVNGKEYVKDQQSEHIPKWPRGTLLAPAEIDIAEKNNIAANTYCE